VPPSTTQKAFACGLSTEDDWKKAASAAAAEARKALGGDCDLGLVFATALYPALEPAALAEIVSEKLGCRLLIGCNSTGVIAGSREVELEPALSVMGLRLPGVKVTAFHLPAAEANALESGADLVKALDVYPVDKPKFLALADPMTCDIDRLVRLVNEAYPAAPVIGGLASGAALGRPGWLLLGGEACSDGAVGVALSGDVDFDIVVAQGCRPIGKPLIATKVEGNVLQTLGGKPPLEVLQELVAALSPEDRKLARHSLFVGLVMDERRPGFQRGDFLIRNLLGSDPSSGALMIAAQLRAGQTLQFQLRDAKTSAEDLRELLGGLARGAGPRGAFLVCCTGRGKGLYGEADHDSRLIQALKGPVPLAGFFASGEIGPVGGKNYVHGYTSSLAVIR
jgi:small ligand-binding sensory domain FIST